jgi:nuclear protein localization family protein 4
MIIRLRSRYVRTGPGTGVPFFFAAPANKNARAHPSPSTTTLLSHTLFTQHSKKHRDGLERVTVPDCATLADLKAAIEVAHGVPAAQMRLATDPGLLTSKAPDTFPEVGGGVGPTALASLGVCHGSLLHMWYPFTRDVAPPPDRPKDLGEGRDFGARMTVADMISAQVRISRQDAPAAGLVALSLDRAAADAFQAYVARATRFGVARCGLMYGRVGEDGVVLADVIYEPPQDSGPDGVVPERGGADEQLADFIAGKLGLSKVGWVLAQAATPPGAPPRDWIMSDAEVRAMAGVQAELGERAVTAVVSAEPSLSGPGGPPGAVHFEAFQASTQCVQLARDGWLTCPYADGAPAGVTKMVDPHEPGKAAPVMIAAKDVSEVDNDYFLVPVPIRDHAGPLTATFPVENRLLPQGGSELKEFLAAAKRRPAPVRYADFHFLLWLAKQPNLDPVSDVGEIAAAVADGRPVSDGYELILESLAQHG